MGRPRLLALTLIWVLGRRRGHRCEIKWPMQPPRRNFLTASLQNTPGVSYEVPSPSSSSISLCPDYANSNARGRQPARSRCCPGLKNEGNEIIIVRAM